MNKILILFLFASFTLISCLKETPNLQQEEIDKRNQYLIENNITTAPTESGLYYIETLEGTGPSPTEGILVDVNYVGRLLDGTEFGSGELTYRFDFNQIIIGFDEAVSYMKKGGTAKAIIPSYLAYGAYEVGSIPSYSTLVFEIELLEVYGEEKEIEDRNQYLLDNNIEMEPTESGLYFMETLTGSGETPDTNNIVEVTYEGKYLDGEVFDSGTFSYTFGTNYVIQGFDEAVGYMMPGGKASIIVPSDLAYGPVGGTTIPGYTTILFDIELLSIAE